MRTHTDILAAIVGLEKVLDAQRLAGIDPEDPQVQAVLQTVVTLRWVAGESLADISSFEDFIERLVADEKKAVQ